MKRQESSDDKLFNEDVIYGDQYLDWKSWTNEDFGTLTNTIESYFSAEILRTNCICKSGLKVLEIGFGNGTFLNYARKAGWQIVGTEANQQLVESARKQGFNAHPSEHLPEIQGCTFDLVVAFDVLEHIEQSNMVEFFKQVERVLKCGGLFVARVPNGDSPFGLKNQNGDVTHLTVIGSGKASYFGVQAKMEIVAINAEAQPILGTDWDVFLYRIFAIPIRKLINFIVNLIFYPNDRIHFCAKNLVLVYRKDNLPIDHG